MARGLLQGGRACDARSARRAATRRRPVRVGDPEAGAAPATSVQAIGASRSSSAAILLSYDVPHRIPWGWSVSLYTWTKGIAAGCFLVAMLVLIPRRRAGLDGPGGTVRSCRASRSRSSGFTGGCWSGTSTHPFRFYLLFTRPQFAQLAREGRLRRPRLRSRRRRLPGQRRCRFGPRAGDPRRSPAVALAVGVACYTGLPLRAGARARSLAEPAPRRRTLAIQAMLAGSACLLAVVFAYGPSRRRARPLEALLAASAAAHLLFVLGETAGSAPHKPRPRRRRRDDPRPPSRFFWPGRRRESQSRSPLRCSASSRRPSPSPGCLPTSTPTSRPASPCRWRERLTRERRRRAGRRQERRARPASDDR